MKLRVLENFAGIGTQRMALDKLGITHEVVGITEIDKFAIKTYEAIHGEVNNLGDISKVDPSIVPDHDLFTYSFPCQDISKAGKGRGFEKGSGTRSGLLWECEKVIKAKKPKYLLMENVKNLVSKKFKPGFQDWLKALEELGYTNYVEVLNAKDYGVPQNRERVFCVSILGEHEPYEFPKKEPLELRLKDILEDEVDEKFYISEEKISKTVFIFEKKDSENGVTSETIDGIGENNFGSQYRQGNRLYNVNNIAIDKKGNYAIKLVNGENAIINKLPTDSNGIDFVGYLDRNKRIKNPTEDQLRLSRTHRQPNRIHSDYGIHPALSASEVSGRYNIMGKSTNYKIRRLTPKECWRLMGISDDDFAKAQEVNSDSQLYKQAGNAIVVNVLEAIFASMFK